MTSSMGSRRPQAKGIGHGGGSLAEAEALHRASNACQATFAYCATERRRVDDLQDLLCLVDCADVCETTARVIAREGDYSDPLRDLCAQQVNDAAATCSKYAGDAMLQDCAAQLRDASDALLAHLDGNVRD